MRIIMGNKRYSSWSLRGWLAVKQSGQPFDELVVPMMTDEWWEKKADPALMPSSRVPTLWDGGTAIWESLAIIDWLADRYGQAAYWPVDGAARAFARSIAAEMHAGFTSLRSQCPMDVLASYPGYRLTDDTQKDVSRISGLWAEARREYGTNGPYLFGSFGAADMMFAPVVMRFRTYGVTLNGDAGIYQDTMCSHPWVTEWCAAAADEPADWTITSYADLAAKYV
ncbi:glutathione S-transferase [Pacificimonas sp. WHA3]|uniref:Glutathione S-transferase n=1 Tax=Pacificimonas pallii TaxID=2827236 RepID=A0ABS6SEL7_9SPHN|nr:glutathione S-transferase [Pacificimonas pallii]MBV7256307.1 glutathione S-transferase [Pacificimonas pallii]